MDIDQRDAILDCAWELFTERGYESITEDDIVEELGISFEAFRRHFDSVRRVLDAIADRICIDQLAELWKLAEDQSLPAAVKLARIVEHSRQTGLSRVGAIARVARALLDDRNLVVRQRVLERMERFSLPALRAIIEQGLVEGAFDVADPREAARFSFAIVTAYTERQTRTLLSCKSQEQKVRELTARAEVGSQSLERILGARAGTLEPPSREIFSLYAEAFEPPATRRDAAGPHRNDGSEHHV